MSLIFIFRQHNTARGKILRSSRSKLIFNYPDPPPFESGREVPLRGQVQDGSLVRQLVGRRLAGRVGGSGVGRREQDLRHAERQAGEVWQGQGETVSTDYVVDVWRTLEK